MQPIRPILNDRDHAEALDRIWRGMDLSHSGAASAADLDEVEILIALVQAYEARQLEAQPALTHAQVIDFHMDRLGLTPDEMAAKLGCSGATLVSCLSHGAPMTELMREALIALGAPAETIVEMFSPPPREGVTC